MKGAVETETQGTNGLPRQEMRYGIRRMRYPANPATTDTQAALQSPQGGDKTSISWVSSCEQEIDDLGTR
jgi:hypothetical protein